VCGSCHFVVWLVLLVIFDGSACVALHVMAQPLAAVAAPTPAIPTSCPYHLGANDPCDGADASQPGLCAQTTAELGSTNPKMIANTVCTPVQSDAVTCEPMVVARMTASTTKADLATQTAALCRAPAQVTPVLSDPQRTGN
jgi:hypothetical protein